MDNKRYANASLALKQAKLIDTDTSHRLFSNIEALLALNSEMLRQLEGEDTIEMGGRLAYHKIVMIHPSSSSHCVPLLNC